MKTTSLSKARTGIFLLLIAISLYSLFMISASNTSYAAGKGLFKFSSLIGLSPSMNDYGRPFRSGNKFEKNLVREASNINVASGVSAAAPAVLQTAEVAEFMSKPRKSNYRRIIAAERRAERNNRSGIVQSDLLLAFSGASGGISSGLVSDCIGRLQPNPDTEELNVDEVIACILNGDPELLADASDPTGNDNGNGTSGDDGSDSGNGNNDPFANDGDGADEDLAGNDDGTGAGNGDGTGAGNDDGTGAGNGDGDLVSVPEPSTYLLLGLGMLSLVGFSRKKQKALIK